MFHKTNSQEILVDPSMEVIPEETKQKNKQTVDQLLEVVKLMAQKFGLEGYVKGRFKDSLPDRVMVTLFNGAHQDSIDDENKRPIKFLKEYGGQEMERQKSIYPCWSNSILTLNQSRLHDIIVGLKLLPTPKDAHPRARVIVM